jgi:hypothetical protein
MKMETKIKLCLFLICGIILLLGSGCIRKGGSESPELNMQTTTTVEKTLENLKNLKNLKISLSTDKELYHSNELMNITVEVNSPEELKNARIRVYGIYSGRYRLNEEKEVDLEIGKNNISFLYKTPRCYGCAGISPGVYEINAELEYDGEIKINETKSVEIRQ